MSITEPTLIFCFGNEIVKMDSLAKELADEMSVEGYKFIKLSRPEQLLEARDSEAIGAAESDDSAGTGHLYLLDVVKGIDKVTLLEIDDLKERKINTLHDFDLQFFLQLMKSVGVIKEVTIIGLPINGEKEKIKKELENLLKQ